MSGSAGIAQASYRRLGGIDQWVMIRGERTTNPPLILLHGGPGLGETAFFRHSLAPLERRFTLVFWDQRGAGKSFDRAIPRSSMTVEQFIADLDELVEIVRHELAAEQVVLFGHSWGSALGPLYAVRFPDKVSAYVGCAQVGDWAAGEAASYADALAEAQRRGHTRALAKLREIGPPPHTAQQLWTERMVVARLEGRMSPRSLWRTARALGPSLLETPAAMRAFRWTLDAMWAEVSQLNLLELAPALAMPASFLLGRQDHWVPPRVSMAYIERLEAPSKQVVWFEHSRHEPFVDEPAAFVAAMAQIRLR